MHGITSSGTERIRRSLMSGTYKKLYKALGEPVRSFNSIPDSEVDKSRIRPL